MDLYLDQVTHNASKLQVTHKYIGMTQQKLGSFEMDLYLDQVTYNVSKLQVTHKCMKWICT